MEVLAFVLLLCAAICFLLYAFGLVSTRVQLIALGLLLWVLVPLIYAGRRL